MSYRERIREALVYVSANVIPSEDPQTPMHAQRLAFANWFAGGTYSTHYAVFLAQFDTLTNAGMSDATLRTLVESVFNDFLNSPAEGFPFA